MFGRSQNIIYDNLSMYILNTNLVIIVIAIIGATPIVKNIINLLKIRLKIPGIIIVVIFCSLILIISTAYLVNESYNWTNKGAYIAYKEMCRQLDLKAKEESDFNINEITNSFYGSLYSKLGAGIGEPDSIDVYLPKKDGDVVVNYVNEGEKIASLYNTKSLEEQDKYQVFTGGNHSLINIKSLADPKKKLLVLKDSYANSFLPFLTAHYGEIDVVDLRYYTDNIDNLIKTDDITDVLFLYNAATFNEDKSILNIVD